jgi:hypothetical protein
MSERLLETARSLVSTSMRIEGKSFRASSTTRQANAAQEPASSLR